MIKKQKFEEVIKWIPYILTAAILALIIRHYIFVPTQVQQTSMYPTLKQGERLVLNKLHQTLKLDILRGDIITFEAPSKKSRLIHEIDVNNPVAIYHEKSNIFSNFVYHVLEIGKTSYIKRVIGIAGDHILIKERKIFLNETLLEETYLQEDSITQGKVFSDIVVPKGYIFVLGDNRQDSQDSRDFGCIPINKVESKVSIRFWPINKFGEIQ